MSFLKRLFSTVIIGALPFVGVFSCYRQEAQEAAHKARKHAEEKKALSRLINEATMAEEIDRLLREKIKLIPEFIIVSDSYGAFAIPRTTLWTIECGPFSGLKIHFGDVTQDTVLMTELFSGPIENSACDALIATSASRFRVYLGKEGILTRDLL